MRRRKTPLVRRYSISLSEPVTGGSVTKRLQGFSALLLMACSGAWAQPAPQSCAGLSDVSGCKGDLACISQVRQAEAACRGSSSVVTVPEPETGLLLMTGLVALVAVARKKRRLSLGD